MSSLASDKVRVGTFWNSPNLRSAVASSSPAFFSRVRDVGADAGVVVDMFWKRYIILPNGRLLRAGFWAQVV